MAAYWFFAILIASVTAAVNVTDSHPAKQTLPDVPAVAQVLAQARRAIGYENLKACKGAFLLQGKADEHGISGTYCLQFTPQGQFLRRLDSRVKDLAAFDGVVGWGVDVSGTPRILEMDDL